ncbi:hypothetical protein QBC36DRAFT_87453 [Triangularia setosa]|uniref:Uncharacterized protein n=1 Tax=Triangularia setosa TaxID=2587417 RepID=A0AAN7A9H9_9PEZI|nr:hypothetical protein QBC36DRAFT_87453 [Podospora setosa]
MAFPPRKVLIVVTIAALTRQICPTNVYNLFFLALRLPTPNNPCRTIKADSQRDNQPSKRPQVEEAKSGISIGTPRATTSLRLSCLV